jgi:hypothetical protein
MVASSMTGSTPSAALTQTANPLTRAGNPNMTASVNAFSAPTSAVAPPAAGDPTLSGVVDRLFGSGLVLASALRRDDISAEVCSRLRDVIDELDGAIAELRGVALDAAVRERDASTGSDAAALVTLVPGAEVRADGARTSRCLRQVADGEVFAYATRGSHFFRASDGVSWARQRGDLLVAARSGAPLARRVGQVFYDVQSHLPLYYESIGGAPTS